MMMARALILWLAMVTATFAAPVKVTTGEHDGFTRIVLSFQGPVEWELGRTDSGYRFRLKAMAAEYDIATVYKRIGKTRLAAIDPVLGTSDLDFGFACLCHAIAFEFRPNIIVIDLRDGAPPEGSAFETPLAPLAQTDAEQGAATLATSAANAAQPYDWLERFGAKISTGQGAEPLNLAPLPSTLLPNTLPNMQPIRDQLFRQLSRGASEGLINLAIPKLNGPFAKRAEVKDARVALGELTGIISQTMRAPKPPMGAEGNICIPTSDLTLLDWAAGQATPDLLAQDMTQLVGEFDAPQPEAVTRAARARIHLGFGLEARLILTAFPDVAEGAGTLLALSYIIDGENDPTQGFHGQGLCNTAAALWAALSDTSITQAQDLNVKAAILAFSALPNHLRRLIGPHLIDRFLELGDETSATTVRNIIFRVTDQLTSEISVAAAKIDLAKGDAAEAEGYLDSSDQGEIQTSAAVLVTRVKARIAQGIPVDRETVTALHALQNEMKNTDMAGEVAIAIIHAEAASGNFPAAFAALADKPAEAAVVWDALVHLGDDTSFLTYAVPAPSRPVDGMARSDIEDIITRLLDLGLPDIALDWGNNHGIFTGKTMARVHLARRDGNAALDALVDEGDADAAGLRAKAYGYLGQHQKAAAELGTIRQADPVPEWVRGKDWASLAEIPTSPWFALANDVQSAPNAPNDTVDTFGPLARGLALVDQSAATRAKIEKLLDALPAPSEN